MNKLKKIKKGEYTWRAPDGSIMRIFRDHYTHRWRIRYTKSLGPDWGGPYNSLDEATQALTLYSGRTP